MIVYRIARTGYATDLTGEGARLFGGRWNHKNTPCLYTSQSRALAVLEYTVNVNTIDIPRALSIIAFTIPDHSIVTFTMADLPGDWQHSPAPSSTKDFGTRLLKESQALVIQIPSVVIPEECNFLLNPLHPAISEVEVMGISDYPYDIRIKLA